MAQTKGKGADGNQGNQGNQTENEFFAMVSTGRRGVEEMMQTMEGEFRKIAAPNVEQNYDMWTQRALVYIANNDELHPVLQNRKGIFSVYKELARAMQMGIQLGGHFPHAHLVKYGNAVSLQPTWEGYAFVAAHGPGAVLRHQPKLIKVCEGDEFTVDESAGVYEHKYQAFGERGKVVGYAMKLEYKDGRVDIAHITRAEVEDIAKQYGNTDSPAWKKRPEAMYDKTAAKQLLKQPAREAEGLAMMYQVEAEYTAPVYDHAAPPRDVTDRTGSRLDERLGATDVEPEPAADEEPEDAGEEEAGGEEPKPEKAATGAEEESGEPRDLF